MVIFLISLSRDFTRFQKVEEGQHNYILNVKENAWKTWGRRACLVSCPLMICAYQKESAAYGLFFLRFTVHGVVIFFGQHWTYLVGLGRYLLGLLPGVHYFSNMWLLLGLQTGFCQKRSKDQTLLLILFLLIT